MRAEFGQDKESQTFNFSPSSFGGWIVENPKALEWTGACLCGIKLIYFLEIR